MAHRNVQDAFSMAVRLLAQRDRTTQEIDRLMARRGVSDSERQEILNRLATLAYLDDARFARTQTEALLRARRFGRREVIRRLTARGLSEDRAQAAFLEISQQLGFDEGAAAAEVLRKRGILLPVDDLKVRARAARLLEARGFSPPTITGLLGDEVLESRAEDD